MNHRPIDTETPLLHDIDIPDFHMELDPTVTLEDQWGAFNYGWNEVDTYLFAREFER